MHTRSLPAKAGNDGYAGTLCAIKTKKNPEIKYWLQQININYKNHESRRKINITAI